MKYCLDLREMDLSLLRLYRCTSENERAICLSLSYRGVAKDEFRNCSFASVSA